MIDLLRPWVLVLLPLPWLAWRLLPPLAANAALPVPTSIRNLMLALSGQSERRAHNAPDDLWLKIIGWLVLVLAIAGPFTRHATLLTPTGRDLMVAVDLSASMEERDMQIDGRVVSRHEVVRELLGRFIQSRRGDRVGLIAYGHESYLIAPLTFDVDAVASILNELTIGLSGHRTDLGRAIGLALKSFDDKEASTRVLILLSDGEDNSGELTGPDAATAAAEAGVRIHTIGFASNIEADGAAILKTIADVGQGRLFWAKSASALKATSNEISQLEPTVRPTDEAHLRRDWSVFFALLALLAMAVLVIKEMRRR
ncbi:MAG: VWA domain-containing protein [Pseudomonadota bacterium]